MRPATVNTMAPSSQVFQTIMEPPRTKAPLQIEGPNAFDLREFVSDEDAVNFNFDSAPWDSIDQTAFVLAQRQALEEFNVAKAIRLSEETAAVESKRRSASAAPRSVPSVSPETQTSSSASSSVGPSNATRSQPIAIRKSQRSGSSASAAASDEAAATSLARSWRVESLQPTLLENNSPVSSSFKTHQKSSSVSTTLGSYHQQPHHDDERKPPSSIVKQPSKNLSLSTSSSSLDTRIASTFDSHSVPLQAHSRATQPNVIQSSTSSTATQSHRIEQRTLSKRGPERSISMSPPSASSPLSQVQVSDVTNTKRRRTEHPTATSTSTSTSTPSHNMLVAPSISHSKKSIASARDVLLGQMINPISEITASQVQVAAAAPSMEKRSKSRHRSIHKPSGSDLFTAPRRCANPQCGKLVNSPRAEPSFAHDPFALPFSALLHVSCPACRAVHCRGCFSIVRCPRDCTGNAACTVRNCCPDVRAIAIFEALSSFDQMYAGEVEVSFASTPGKSGSAYPSAGTPFQSLSRQQRLTFIKRVMTKADPNSRFENVFVCTLRILSSWLQHESEASNSGLHPSVPTLLASSFLPEVIHAFLSNTHVRDWIPHSVTYSTILDTLKCMFDCGLKELMTRPLVHIEQSPGLQALMWDKGTVVWEPDLPHQHGSGNLGKPVEAASLCDAVRQLEKYRVPLMALAEKVKFERTVEKVNNLCDGISYLLLQQVVGGL